MKRFILFVLIAFAIVGCGTPKPSVQAVAEQIITALDQGDMATLNTLVDNDMPMKSMAITIRRNSWKDTLSWVGPLLRMEVEAPQQAGASTIVVVHTYHEQGETFTEITLHETDDGWRALAWDYAKPDLHYTPTPER
jgi:PBP1b-binding outer membrane lipoprotein LpoB